MASDPPNILYYRVALPTSAYFTRTGMWVEGETREGVAYLTLLFSDRKQVEFRADAVEPRRTWKADEAWHARD